MSGLIIDGTEHQVPGLQIENFRDDDSLRLRVGETDGNNDGKRRHVKWINKIVLHTTKGIPGGRNKQPQQILPGVGPSSPQGKRTAQFWSHDPRPSGAHLVVGFDRLVSCLTDLQMVAAYHAGDGALNEHSIGIEIYQGPNGELYEGQLDAVVTLVDYLTAHFRIQRQIPHEYGGPIDRLARGGRDCVGVFGHRDCTDRRGPGDPGDAIMERLAAAGYERFDFNKGEDTHAWRQRQKLLNPDGQYHLTVDGIPGPATTRELELRGYQHGLWVLEPSTNGESIVWEAIDRVVVGLRGIGRQKVLDYVRTWLAKQ